MKSMIETISDSGLREKVKIMIVGGQIDEEVMQYTSVDVYSVDAMAAVDLAKGWLGF